MENQTVTLDLTIQQLNIILAGLVKLPIEMALETFNDVQQQAQTKLGPPARTDGPLANKVIN